MAIIDAKQIGGALEIKDPETDEPARVPGETGDGKVATHDRTLLEAVDELHETMREIRDLLMEAVRS